VTERGGVSQLVDNNVPNVAQWARDCVSRWAPPSTLLALAERSLGARCCLEMNIRQKTESVADAQCKYAGTIHCFDGKTFRTSTAIARPALISDLWLPKTSDPCISVV
jgi:hypothetical protein